MPINLYTITQKKLLKYIVSIVPINKIKCQYRFSIDNIRQIDKNNFVFNLNSKQRHYRVCKIDVFDVVSYPFLRLQPLSMWSSRRPNIKYIYKSDVNKKLPNRVIIIVIINLWTVRKSSKYFALFLNCSNSVWATSYTNLDPVRKNGRDKDHLLIRDLTMNETNVSNIILIFKNDFYFFVVNLCLFLSQWISNANKCSWYCGALYSIETLVWLTDWW